MLHVTDEPNSSPPPLSPRTRSSATLAPVQSPSLVIHDEPFTLPSTSQDTPFELTLFATHVPPSSSTDPLVPSKLSHTSLKRQSSSTHPASIVPSPTSSVPSIRRRFFKVVSKWFFYMKKNWFLFCLPWVIVLAYFIPGVGKSGGPLHTEYSAKYGAVMTIFFFSGLGLEGSILKTFWLHWRVHLVIQCVSFGLLPLLGYSFTKLLLLIPWMSTNLANGLTVALSMPTTISSNVIMTAKAKGNDIVSLINATLGNLLGVLISPLLVKLYLGNTVTLNFGRIMLEMTITVIVPLILGQLVRFVCVRFNWRGFNRIPMSILSSLMLLFMVFSTFCNTFSDSASVQVFPFLLVLVSIFILLSLAMILSFFLGRALFQPKEVISLVYCGSTKTLSLGIPLLALIFPNQAEPTIPLLLYHALQLFLGGGAAGFLARWVDKCMQSQTVSS